MARRPRYLLHHAVSGHHFITSAGSSSPTPRGGCAAVLLLLSDQQQPATPMSRNSTPAFFLCPRPQGSSSSSSLASISLQVTLCSAPSSQQQAPDFCTPTWGCAVPTQGAAWVLDSPTLRRRSARFDCLRVSLHRICAAPTCHRGNPCPCRRHALRIARRQRAQTNGMHARHESARTER
ncbi:uncharacterized protein [Zea mays]|uniref:uncharacterized protein n=1 Tax=Zea mays TaxID=4577 RepID=UPI000C6C431D|nr:uncharacterized protein LOC111590138 [Zea mays]|eukprot:XP_023156819.1 uncharacterized protein LOC111590138 [Zea mays]